MQKNSQNLTTRLHLKSFIFKSFSKKYVSFSITTTVLYDVFFREVSNRNFRYCTSNSIRSCDLFDEKKM